MAIVLEKETIRESLKSLSQTDPDFVKALFEEIDDLIKPEHQLSKDDWKRKRLEAIIKEDFEEYDDVFRKLA
jgi:hypothetical protein